MFKTTLLIGLLAWDVTATPSLRAAAPAPVEEEAEAFDLELTVEGRRELFSLLPGTKCPAGHKCHARPRSIKAGGEEMMAHLKNVRGGVSPLMGVLKDNMAEPLAQQEALALNTALKTTVESNDYCQRRGAMARAAGLAAGLAIATVSQPSFAAATKEVLMGDNSGQLVFVPKEISVCKGDTVKWIINKAGPHNVVFDEEAIPKGVSQEAISMEGQIGEEGDSFEMSFDVAGTYEYYCEPHRSAGMNGILKVA